MKEGEQPRGTGSTPFYTSYNGSSPDPYDFLHQGTRERLCVRIAYVRRREMGARSSRIKTFQATKDVKKKKDL